VATSMRAAHCVREFSASRSIVNAQPLITGIGQPTPTGRLPLANALSQSAL
jgi:hypothetical protein